MLTKQATTKAVPRTHRQWGREVLKEASLQDSLLTAEMMAMATGTLREATHLKEAHRLATEILTTRE
jgi:hypothetical protein